MKNKIKKLFGIVFVIGLIFSNILLVSATTENKYTNYDDAVVSCGNGMITSIPTILPKVTSVAYTLIQIAVPVVLVIFGMLDLVKGIMASKEDEIKKGQHTLIKRAITAALIFFVFAVVKFVISFAAEESSADILACTDCFISNKCYNDDLEGTLVCDRIFYDVDSSYKYSIYQDENGNYFLKNINGHRPTAKVEFEYIPSNKYECSNASVKFNSDTKSFTVYNKNN